MRLAAALCLLLLGTPAWGQGSRDIVPAADYFEVSSALVSGAPLTIVGWAIPDTDVHLRLFSIANSGLSGTWYHVLGLASSRVLWCHANSSGTSAQSATTDTYSLGAWSHFGCVFASSTSRTAYLQGVAASENTASIVPAGLNATSLGRLGDSTPSNETDAKVAHFALWNVALDADEMADLSGGKSPLLVRRGSLVGYWPLQENAGSDNALDLSGNGNDLTQTSSPAPISDSPPIYIPGPPP